MFRSFINLTDMDQDLDKNADVDGEWTHLTQEGDGPLTHGMTVADIRPDHIIEWLLYTLNGEGIEEMTLN